MCSSSAQVSPHNCEDCVGKKLRKDTVNKYLKPQAKNLLGSAFHAIFVQDKDAPRLVLKCLKVC